MKRLHAQHIVNSWIYMDSTRTKPLLLSSSVKAVTVCSLTPTYLTWSSLDNQFLFAYNSHTTSVLYYRWCFFPRKYKEMNLVIHPSLLGWFCLPILLNPTNLYKLSWWQVCLNKFVKLTCIVNIVAFGYRKLNFQTCNFQYFYIISQTCYIPLDSIEK